MMSKRDTSTQKMGNTTKNQSSIFKPLIASSLALALGVSVGYADITITIPDTPTGNTSEWQFIWNGIQSDVVGGGSTNVYQPALTGGSDSISTLVFKFGSAPAGSGNAAEYTATTGDSNITINDGGSGGSKGRAIQMGNGNGTLKVHFDTSTNKNFVLDLSNTDSSLKYSFVGNIVTTRDGIDSGNGTGNYQGSRYFKAIFAKSVKGDITLDSGGASTESNPTLDFKNGAKLEGSLTMGHDDTFVLFEGNGVDGNGGEIVGNVAKTNTGTSKIKFKNSGKITGNLSKTTGADNIIKGELGVEFVGEGMIDGNISVNRGDLSIIFNANGTIGDEKQSKQTEILATSGANTISFKGNTNSIYGSIVAKDRFYKNSNTVKFTETTASNTIKGIVSAIGNTYGSSTNTVTMYGTTSNTIQAISGENEGNAISAKDAGHNDITLGKKDTNGIVTTNATNSIIGNIYTKGTNVDSASQNTITLNGNTNEIRGNITSEGSSFEGNATITMNATTSNTITGTITAGSFTNNEITFNSVKNTIGLDGQTSINIINANDGNNTIKSQKSNSINIIYGNVASSYSGFKLGTNSITFEGSTNTIQGNVSSTGGSSTIKLGADSNTSATNSIAGGISISGAKNKGGKGTGSFTFAGATNTIGGGVSVTAGTTGAENSIIFSNGTSKIGGDIDNSGGTNTITSSSGTLEIGGGITNNAGQNSITASSGTLSFTHSDTSFSAKGGGTATNTITAATLNITNASLSADGNHSGNNDNLITASATGTITLSSISVNGETDNNSNVVYLANGTLKVAGDISAARGKNILNNTAGTITFGDAYTSTAISANNGQNIISIGSGDANTLTLSSISADNANGRNIIAKDIVEGASADVLTLKNIALNTYLSDTQAFEGQLTISAGVTGNNTISYKASSSQTSAVISNFVDDSSSARTLALGTAISGSNTIYLNVSGSGIQSAIGGMTSSDLNSYKNSSVILGHVQNSGTTNIKIVGTANTSTPVAPSPDPTGRVASTSTIVDNAQIGILGNIINDSGALNIVLQDTFFAPSAIVVNSSGTKTTKPVGGGQAGNITTASGATTNVVTRFTTSPSSSGISMYNISGDGTTNVVIEGSVNVGTNIDYSKNSAINLIFANAHNSGAADSFEADNIDVTNDSSVVLGVTYQDGVKLAIKDKTVLIGDSEASFLDTYASYYTDGSTPLATVTTDRVSDPAKDTITIHGLVVGNIYSLADGQVKKTYDVTLESGSAFAGNIALDPKTTTAITLKMNAGSKLILADVSDSNAANNFVISSLNITSGSVDAYQLQTETLKQSNTVINIATGGASANNVVSREDFRLLTIGNATSVNAPDTTGGLSGDGTAVFMTYVNTNANQNNATLGGVSSSSKTTNVVARGGARAIAEGSYGNLYSDRIIIANIGDNTTAQSGDYYMQFAVDANSKLGSVTYDASNDKNGNGGTKTAGNIAVLTVVNTGTVDGVKTAGITLKTQDVLQGFDRIGGDLVAVQTDINGVYNESGGYTTYFINSLTTRGATEATQEVTASAFATNYDLYLANFNSLNKRMGELRDNDNSQGVWARVFSGAQSNDFSKSKSTYTTIQGGYDYALGMEGANNYIGLAVAYSMSSSKSDLNAIDINGSTKGIEDIKSSAVEVAVYNSYVQDEGWYNDTIAKFSYIMSDFKMTGQTSNYSTNNMAFTLSDEFGYRFKLGEAKEWYIDPQLEVAFGYFNQSDFVQTLGLSTLDGVADSIYTTRARFGSSFGYDFKKFTENKPIKASVYVGAFYEYDYIAGGDVTLTTNLGGETVSSSAISSDGRVVMNVGTNMTIKENTRIYFDFETSFAGKIRTDYQANVGVRYSFGENTGYTPVDPNKKSITPLKVSDENASEKEKVENTQESTENTNSKAKSETTTEQNTNSTENTTEEKAQ